MFQKGLRTCLITFGFVGLIGGSATATEFLLYPSCNAGVQGTLRATASLASGDRTCLREDTCEFDRRIPLNTTSNSFAGRCEVGVRVGKSLRARCATRATASSSGKSRYEFNGGDQRMSFDFRSRNSQADSVRRFSNGGRSGVFARSGNDLAGHNQFIMGLPFLVGGGDGASLQVSFGLDRSDSGPSTGYVSTSWYVYGDANGNCEIDRNETIVAMNMASVGPNQSVSMPSQTFATPRGNYILVVVHEFTNNLAADSQNCRQSVANASDIGHALDLDLSLVTTCP